MNNKGQANREVCNVAILDYKTGAPYMYYEYANTTGLELTSDNVNAMAHGTKKIAFANPLEGTISITAQVVPFKMYALYSDGIIDSTSENFYTTKITCTTAGELPLAVSKGTIVSGTVFVYKEGEFGGTPITGTYATNKFTATETTDIAANSVYEVGFMVKRTEGVEKIALNSNRKPKAVAIFMDTFEKDEDENLIPLRINVHKASIQRNLSLSFSSEGDPAEVTLTFDILEKDKDSFVDFTEITEETVINPAVEDDDD